MRDKKGNRSYLREELAKRAEDGHVVAHLRTLEEAAESGPAMNYWDPATEAWFRRRVGERERLGFAVLLAL
jgi:hypothetical protein